MPSDYHNIRVRKTNKQKIKLLAERHGKTETDFANRMINFIYDSGLDIYSKMPPNVPDLVKNLDRRLVSFLKKRETDFFIPMQQSFKEMIRMHTRTFEMLDVLHPGEIGLHPKEKNQQQEAPKPSFKIPENEALKTGLIIPSEQDENNPGEGLQNRSENTVENHAISDIEKEDYINQIQRLEKEKKTFEKELLFLLKNLKPNKAISGPKFTCDLPQKEIDRIKILTGGH